MRYFPFFFDLKNKTALVIGNGDEAAQKIRLLLKSCVTIKLIGKDLSGELQQLLQSHAIDILSEAFGEHHLDDIACVVCANIDEHTARNVLTAAKQRNIPVNVVDRADLSTFIFPAIVDRDPLVIAIGTEGTGPVMAQGIRAHLERYLPFQLGDLMRLAENLRPQVQQKIPNGASRRQFWHQVFFGRLRDIFISRGEAAFHAAVREKLGASTAAQPSFHVIIPHPQHADLLPLRAHRLLQEADLVVYGANHQETLELARRDCARLEENDLAELINSAADIYTGHQKIIRIIDAQTLAWLPQCDVFPWWNGAALDYEVISSGHTDENQLADSWQQLLTAAPTEIAEWRLAS